MNGKKKQFKTILLLASFLLAVLIVLSGCEKKSKPAAPAETEEAVSAAIVQKTCPIMGGAINKDFFTEYKGKKVYFCCPPCKEKFAASPEKYIAKLPQFNN